MKIDNGKIVEKKDTFSRTACDYGRFGWHFLRTEPSDQIRSDQMCIDNNMANNNGEAKEKHNSYSIRVQFPQIQSQPVKM
ncbi:hypothetical protein T06_9384 [Trichinella sp. T6]|nr:hypothetical protein T06_9384 [Trichinella sp. T6]